MSSRPQRWLSIVGIGEDGVDGLSPIARRLVSGAELVLGGKRHLALADSLIRGQRISWPSPIGTVLPDIEKHRGQPVTVLASGDPFHYGVGDMLMRSSVSRRCSASRSNGPRACSRRRSGGKSLRSGRSMMRAM